MPDHEQRKKINKKTLFFFFSVAYEERKEYPGCIR